MIFDILENVLVMVVTLGVLITFHEWGHFQVARWCGVGVLRFSVGFGPSLLRWKDKKGTEFVLAAIPLGGYVKMVDEREGAVPESDKSKAFNRQPVSKRIAIVAAGPIANFVLAVVVFWAVLQGGVTQLVPVIGHVEAGSLAEKAGLEQGQEIVAIDGKETQSWSDVQMALVNRLGESGSLKVSVKYPESNLVYASTVWLDQWLRGVENPDPLKGLGLNPWQPEIKPVLQQVLEGSPAEKAGLQAGDKITTLNGQPIGTWDELVDFVQHKPGTTILLGYFRDGYQREVSLTTEAVTNNQGVSVGRIGVSPVVPVIPENKLRKLNYGLLTAWLPALKETVRLSSYTLVSIGKVLTGEISTKNLSGPITIAKVATSQAENGLTSWLNFLAFLSISLGVINLLPIPVLDGGHLLFYIVEAVIRRPVSEAVQVMGMKVGVVLVVSMMMLAIYYDVLRLVK